MTTNRLKGNTVDPAFDAFYSKIRNSLELAAGEHFSMLPFGLKIIEDINKSGFPPKLITFQ